MRARAAVLIAATLASLAGAALATAPAAVAHPLGNATVNHYDGLALYPNRIVDSAVDLAQAGSIMPV